MMTFWPFLKGMAGRRQAVTTPGHSSRKGPGRSNSKGLGRASGDSPLALSKGRGMGRAGRDYLMALFDGKSKGRTSGAKEK